MKTFFIILFSLFASQAKADYYFILFSQDSKPVSVPFFCHVWGTFVHIEDGKLQKEITISWEPDKTNLLDRPVSASHSSLHGCLEFAQKKKCIVRAWGPSKISKELFLKAEQQYCKPGKYKFFDTFSRKKNACNCIHRLSDVVGELKTGIYWGYWAADKIHKFMLKKNLLEKTDKSEEVINLLQLNKYKIKRI